MAEHPLKGKKVTVMGLGLNQGGVGAVKFLAHEGAIITVTDLRSKEELQESIKKLKGISGVKYVFGQHRIEDFTGADMIIRSPGIKLSARPLREAKAAGVPIETAVGIFVERAKGPIIGITGTRGKTTTTTLLYNMMKRENGNVILGGNIGKSPLDDIAKAEKGTPAVLELSSWQVEAMAAHKKSPSIAVITNIYPDHLNHYESYEAYIEAKQKILEFQNSSDIAVLNYNDEKLQEMAKGAAATIMWFSTTKLGAPQSCFVEGKNIVYRDADGGLTTIASLDDVRLPGVHNLENILAATTAAIAMNVSPKAIQKTIKETEAIRNRLQSIATKNGVEIINDTTSTMPVALQAALGTMTKPVVAIVGGNDKNVDYEEVSKQLFEQAKDIILLEGTATTKIQKHLKQIQEEKRTDRHFAVVDNLKDAVTAAMKSAEKGDVLLFSPGATSFGMHKNEFDRGREFEEIIKSL